MFWRKQKAAIAGFHPLHQGLIHERTLAADLSKEQWGELLGSLANHDAHVRRRAWRLPGRAVGVLVPLVRLLREDMGSKGTLSLRADLLGQMAPGKVGPSVRIEHPNRRVRAAHQSWALDQWLWLGAQLRDGGTMELTVVDRCRIRKLRVWNGRKTKFKTKHKTVQRIAAKLTLPPGREPVRPANPPPPWMRVSVKPGKRTTVTAIVKAPPVGRGESELDRLLLVMGEPFRWVSPVAGGAGRQGGAGA